MDVDVRLTVNQVWLTESEEYPDGSAPSSDKKHRAFDRKVYVSYRQTCLSDGK